MSKVPTQLFTNSNMNQINQINSMIIQNEEESFMTKLKNFKNSCPLIIKSIIIFNIINLFITTMCLSLLLKATNKVSKSAKLKLISDIKCKLLKIGK